MTRTKRSRGKQPKRGSIWSRAARRWNRATRPRPSLPRSSDLLKQIYEGRVCLPEGLRLVDDTRSRARRQRRIVHSTGAHTSVLVGYAKQPDEGALVRSSVLLLRLNTGVDGRAVDGVALIAPEYSIWTYETARQLNSDAGFQRFRLYVGERRRGVIKIRPCRWADCGIPRWADIRESFKVDQRSH